MTIFIKPDYSFQHICYYCKKHEAVQGKEVSQPMYRVIHTECPYFIASMPTGLTCEDGCLCMATRMTGSIT